jgi:GntP family gluconate:H+ symporter
LAHRRAQSHFDLVSHDARLIASAIGAVMLLILLIARFKINSFVALIVASLAAGLFCGMNLPDVAKAFGEGVGAVLGSVAMVIGLGAIIGKMLAVSGGAEVIAKTIAGALGEKRLPWAIVVIALIVGLPVFFPVGLVLLTPIIAAIARRSGVNFLTLALPMAAGLSVAHGLVPPHPGPMVAIETLHADAGKTIIYSLIIGVPAALISGPIFGKWISTKASAPQIAAPAHQGPMPTFLATVLTVSLPILLMLLSTAADLTLAKNHPLRAAANFAGSPVCALTISVLVSFFAFGICRGFSGHDILKFTEESLGPTASAILVVGAGGGFNKILVVSGVGEVISRAATSAQLSPLLLGWVVAALIRIATGSATVAISTAAGILAPIAAAQPVNRELLVVVMGAGSLILSHVNDGGFWFVKEYLNLSVAQTLRTWTIIETIIALLGLAGGLAQNQF